MMPGPPPPPPPGPPPPPVAFAPPKGGPDNRSALLKSIEKGARLKKTVTNDKSAPLIGKTSNLSSSSGNSNSNDAASSRSGNTGASNGVGPMGLGGLFAGGMPKLKSTGLRTESATSSGNNSSSLSSIPKSSTAPSPSNQKFNNIQNELKKQMANDNRARGPPPPAPVRNLNSSEPQLNHRNGNVNGLNPSPISAAPLGVVTPTPNVSSLHRNAQSNLNLSTWESGTEAPIGGRPVISHGKPNLAPRPPQTNGKPAAPPKKLINGSSSAISRAQSMRNSSPRQQPTTPDSPDGGPSPPPKFGTVRHMPMGGLSHARSRPTLNGRPTDPPPSIPVMPLPPPPPTGAAPPVIQHGTPPPPSRTQQQQQQQQQQMAQQSSLHQQLQQLQQQQQQQRPAHSIPQAPSVPPPPPPHQRTLRPPPPVPAPSSNAAPPPPPRFSSMRDRTGCEFETRFQFRNISEFPRPNVFKSVPKNYRGKSVGKQPAPLPPNNYQLSTRVWDSATS